MDITLVDVTARDGLQDASGYVPTDAKKSLIAGLHEAGYKKIEVTSFVHPRWVPMFPDAEEVLEFSRNFMDLEGICLVPNFRGLDRVMAAGGANVITVVCSASEAHNQANLNRTRANTLEELASLVAAAHRAGTSVRGALSTTFDCPFSGPVPVADVLYVLQAYLDMGIDVVAIADTIGTATPDAVREKLTYINGLRGTTPLSFHIHDRNGQGLSNVAVALELGISEFESALGGLGGCPYAPGAPGNLNSEVLIPFLERQGISVGVDLEALQHVREEILSIVALDLKPPSR